MARRMFRTCLIITIIFSLAGCHRDAAQQYLDAASVDDTLLERQDRQIRTAILFTLIPVVVAFSFFVFIFYRARREAFFKQQEVEFRLGMSELEMKALRAQMNPHFIFNCLNSIHHCMRGNDVALAGDYLVKFSQLIRYVLESSSFRMIPLSEDLDALRAYLQLEQFRMHHAFQFRIDVASIPDPQSVYVPSMMIQPFVENAIWHGLSQSGPGGFIQVALTPEGNDLLRCVIEDNGRRAKEDITHMMPGIRKTSMGMTLINERIGAVNRIFKTQAGFTMEDRLQDPDPTPGTRIVLKLPFEQD